jgi:MFS family permease
MAILPLVYGLLRENAPAEKVPLGVGILGGVYTLGAGAGTLMGGLIVDYFHWQGIFILSAGFALVALCSSAALLPASRFPPLAGRVDILGWASPSSTGAHGTIRRCSAACWVDWRCSASGYGTNCDYPTP